MKITIQTIRSKFFFSGDIYLNPDESLLVDLSKLTETQLLDIIEAKFLRNLIVSDGDLELVKKEYNTRDSNSNQELDQKVDSLQDTVDNLVDGKVQSIVYWSSTDW